MRTSVPVSLMLVHCHRQLQQQLLVTFTVGRFRPGRPVTYSPSESSVDWPPGPSYSSHNSVGLKLTRLFMGWGFTARHVSAYSFSNLNSSLQNTVEILYVASGRFVKQERLVGEQRTRTLVISENIMWIPSRNFSKSLMYLTYFSDRRAPRRGIMNKKLY